MGIASLDYWISGIFEMASSLLMHPCMNIRRFLLRTEAQDEMRPG